MKRMWSKNELIKIATLLLASGQLQEVDSQDFKIDGESALQKWDGTLALPEGLTINASYCKVVRNFNELQFIFNCRVTNETENAISISDGVAIASYSALEDELKEKIYDHSGANCVVSAFGSIACSTLFVTKTNATMDTQNPRYGNLYNDSHIIKFYLGGGSIVIAPSEVLDFECRISLAL